MLKGYPYLNGFIIRGFIWDIPILSFAYVLFWCPKNVLVSPCEALRRALSEHCYAAPLTTDERKEATRQVAAISFHTAVLCDP